MLDQYQNHDSACTTHLTRLHAGCGHDAVRVLLWTLLTPWLCRGVGYNQGPLSNLVVSVCLYACCSGDRLEAHQHIRHVPGGADLSGGSQQQAQPAEPAVAGLEGSTRQQGGQQGHSHSHHQQHGHQQRGIHTLWTCSAGLRA